MYGFTRTLKITVLSAAITVFDGCCMASTNVQCPRFGQVRSFILQSPSPRAATSEAHRGQACGLEPQPSSTDCRHARARPCVRRGCSARGPTGHVLRRCAQELDLPWDYAARTSPKRELAQKCERNTRGRVWARCYAASPRTSRPTHRCNCMPRTQKHETGALTSLRTLLTPTEAAV